MKRTILPALCLLALGSALFLQLKPIRAAAPETRFFGADNPNFRYTGRISFADPKLPRMWAPGAYVQAKFRGPICDVVVNDENLWGKSHNYLEIAVDDRAPVRVQTTGKTNTFRVADGLSDGTHTLTVCKDTEAGIGYVEFVGLRAAGLARAPKLPSRKLEFYGDSITAGTGSDTSVKACGVGEWYDQHNAYMSYGPTTARMLNARWQLTAQSGIGIIHSCCDMKVTMPDTWDKADRENKIGWDFKRYQPDAVMVALGQNDGAGNAEKFRATYIDFLHKLRAVYPKAQLVCISSPMADANLRAFMRDNLTQIAAEMNRSGDKNVHAFLFSRGFNSGCGGHPDVAEHQLVAGELAGFLKTTLGWK